MRSASPELDQYLEDLARDARPGHRLPPIRDLMRRFGASQMVVQRAFSSLKARGLIASQVGRGTFFVAADGAPQRASGGAHASALAASATPAIRSVLLLRRSISIVRGRVLIEGLQRRFAADGHRVLEVAYTDPDHARTVLKGLPHFDACVIQSTFKTIPIDLLAALRDKSEVLAVDGMALVGTEVEAVGMEWGEPLSTAIDFLQQRGHRRIAFATTSHPLLAGQLGLRRFEQLKRTQPGIELQTLAVPLLPNEGYEAALVKMLADMLAGLRVSGREASGPLPFSALVAWGIEDGAKFRALLSQAGIEVPSALSVVLLGRTDLPNEHADFFDTVGCSVGDQVEQLHRAINARWSDPSRPYGICLIPLAGRAGHSVAEPPSSDAPQRRRAARPAKASARPATRSSAHR